MRTKTFIVGIKGYNEIMFDRVAFDNTKIGKVLTLPWDEKVYLSESNPGQLVIPTINIFSMLTNLSDGAPYLKEKKAAEARRQCINVKRTISFSDKEALLLRNGKPATIADCEHHQSKAPDPKAHSPILTSRPVLNSVWSTEFKINIIEIAGINSLVIQTYIELAGSLVGLGTNRGPYGKFEMVKWEEVI